MLNNIITTVMFTVLIILSILLSIILLGTVEYFFGGTGLAIVMISSMMVFPISTVLLERR